MSVIRVFAKHCKVVHAWPGDRVRSVGRRSDGACRVFVDGPGWVDDVPAPAEAIAEGIRRSQEGNDASVYVDVGVD